jgi:hypothetical protein
MKSSEYVKNEGLKNLKELGEITQIPPTTLTNWFKRKHQAFRCLVLGAAKIKRDSINEGK